MRCVAARRLANSNDPFTAAVMSDLFVRSSEAVRQSRGRSGTQLRRQDVVERLAAYREFSVTKWLFIGIGGLALGPSLITLGSWLAWPDVLSPVFFAMGWAIMLGALAVSWKQERATRARYQVHCPACAEPLLDSTVASRGASRIEVAIASGRCPHCGDVIFET